MRQDVFLKVVSIAAAGAVCAAGGWMAIGLGRPARGPASCCTVDGKGAPLRAAATPHGGINLAAEDAATPAATQTRPLSPPDRPPEKAPDGMVWIPGGEFSMGGADPLARPDESPVHRVRVDGFWIDATEVTNARFARFVEATGYKTVAERAVDWEELKKQLPPGTPKPDEQLLKPGSLVFVAPSGAVRLDDPGRWWVWTTGADWRHPQGPASGIEGMDDLPVVHVAYEDAAAYAKWAGKTLPTEAQWEYAARGGLDGKVNVWGDEPTDASRCNIWEGRFPDMNTAADGFVGAAPVKSFPANGYGLYDMAGNVWEWCGDLYRADQYAREAAALGRAAEDGRPGGDGGAPVAVNPTGPTTSVDPRNPGAPEIRVQRGGSFLCNDAYCASYRPSARMGGAPDTGLSHLGFRCVKPGAAKVAPLAP